MGDMVQTPTILVVDDDVEWRKFIGNALGEDYPVRFATNGDDALRIAYETRPGVIVLDVMLPDGMDGFMILCELKKLPETCDIPVVMLSEVNAVADADFNQEILAQYLGNEPSCFLEKPVDPRRLREVVQGLLAKSDTG